MVNIIDNYHIYELMSEALETDFIEESREVLALVISSFGYDGDKYVSENYTDFEALDCVFDFNNTGFAVISESYTSYLQELDGKKIAKTKKMLKKIGLYQGLFGTGKKVDDMYNNLRKIHKDKAAIRAWKRGEQVVGKWTEKELKDYADKIQSFKANLKNAETNNMAKTVIDKLKDKISKMTDVFTKMKSKGTAGSSKWNKFSAGMVDDLHKQRQREARRGLKDLKFKKIDTVMNVLPWLIYGGIALSPVIALIINSFKKSAEKIGKKRAAAKAKRLAQKIKERASQTKNDKLAKTASELEKKYAEMEKQPS